MGNFGPVAAEIGSLAWGTPANFNGFRVLAALLHGTLVVGVSQTAAFNRGHHLYSAGRPPRWALAYISSYLFLTFITSMVCTAVRRLRRNFVLRPIIKSVDRDDDVRRPTRTYG